MRSLLRFLYFFFPVSWLLAACTTVRTVERAELSPPNPLTRVLVTRADHSTVVVDYPRVSADSLIGVVSGWPERLPLSEVALLRVREPSPERTAGLVFVGAAGVLAFALYLVDKTPPPQPCQIECW